MRLIREYEMLLEATPPLSESFQKEGLVYSDLLPDLELIQAQLENAQLNIDILKVYNDEERPADLHIIEDVKEERRRRQREV